MLHDFTLLPSSVDGAGAAVAGVAPDDGPGLAEPFAQVVDEEHAWFDVVGVLRAVDGDFDLGHQDTPGGRAADWSCDERHVRPPRLAKGWCARPGPPTAPGTGTNHPFRRRVRDPGRMTERNVLGGELEPCGTDPVTGLLPRRLLHDRPGGPRQPHDLRRRHRRVPRPPARHRQRPDRRPMPQYRFPGLIPGDRWCVTAANWLRAYDDGAAAPWCWPRPTSARWTSCRSRRCASTPSTSRPTPARSPPDAGRLSGRRRPAGP